LKKIDGTNPLENILYVSIPDSFNEKIGDFEIDPEILLPVETTETQKDWDISDLTWEMIISAMLKILAYQPDHEDSDYFRRFVLAVKPTIISDLTNSAVIKAQDKNFDLAEEIFLALRGLDPENVILKLNLILLYEQRWEYAKVVENIDLENKYRVSAEAGFKEIASSENPPDIVWYYLGFFYYKIGNFILSEQNFTTYAKLGTESDKIEESERLAKEIEVMNMNDKLFQEAHNMIHNGQEKDGLIKIKEFLEKNEDVWNAWFLLGWGERRLGHYIEAKEAFKKALDKGKPNSDLYNELAICEMELLNLAESRIYLDKAIILDPDNMKIVSNMGILAVKSGKLDEAESFFKIALEIEPNDPVAKQYMIFLENNK
jgi:tetratricopeptide (TPR) repeat protein